MRFVIVTGMSGAGKSTVLKMLEDAGYFCVDNLPVPLVDKFAQLAGNPSQEYSRVALGVDVRSVHSEEDIAGLLRLLEEGGYTFEILFLDADDAALVKRYKETRRAHPLSRNGRVDEGIAKERLIMRQIRERADHIIDTSRLLTRDLRAEINRIYVEQLSYRNMFVTVLSFGFKYGIPSDADLVFDVRFLPNPYYVESLKCLTGEDERVREYVMQGETGKAFEDRWFDMLDFLIPNYISEGKNQLVIAVGCTGGKHRSVTLALHLYEHLLEAQVYGVRLEHRDIHR